MSEWVGEWVVGGWVGGVGEWWVVVGGWVGGWVSE